MLDFKRILYESFNVFVKRCWSAKAGIFNLPILNFTQYLANIRCAGYIDVYVKRIYKHKRDT